MSHTNPLPELPAPDVPNTRLALADAYRLGSYSRTLTAMIQREAYDLGARSTARPSDDALWDQTLRERDRYHEWADKLAEAISRFIGFDIGEHSNVNNPWARAVDMVPAGTLIEALAQARSTAAQPADDTVQIPRSALRWLFGEEGEFECPARLYFRGKPPGYWWRAVFREKIAAPPAASGEPIISMKRSERESLSPEALALLTTTVRDVHLGGPDSVGAQAAAENRRKLWRREVDASRAAASGDSTPPSARGDVFKPLGRCTCAGPDGPCEACESNREAYEEWLDERRESQGDPSGAPRAEPEAVGPDCHGLDTPERVRFYEHDFYVLSNFSAFNVAQGGFMFQTAEHLYHYMKFARPWGDEDRGKPIDWSGPEILVAQAIFGATSAHEAFKIAEQNKALRRPDWDQVKVSFMRDILRAKAMQHSYVLRKLLATGDRELVEDSWRDDFWGWGPNRDGKNMLGRLWMEVRAEFRAAEPPQAASVERGD